MRDTLDEDLANGSGLIEAIHHSHAQILEEISTREGSNMGSTVVALQLKGEEYEVAWVGDSRAYLITSSEGIRQITTDHSLVERLVALGQIKPDEARVHPQRNVTMYKSRV